MPATLDTHHESIISPFEKQDRLNDLTDRYFRGDMSLEDFITQRDAYSIDYEALIEEIASRQARRKSTATDVSTDIQRTAVSIPDPQSLTIFGLLLFALGIKKRKSEGRETPTI